ncbi:PIG-L family deacetylase, partial [Sinomonas atrocyanea]
MVTFSHLDEGTPEDLWRRDAALAAAPPLDLAGLRALIVLAAHPDDETLGAGGLIAHAARAGAAVHVIVATDGEASHPDSPTLTRARLAEVRRREVGAAVAALAPSATFRRLGLPDGALADRGPALERTLVEAVRDALGEAEDGGAAAGVVLA